MYGTMTDKIVIFVLGFLYSIHSTANSSFYERERLAVVHSAQACLSLLSHPSPLPNLSAQFDFNKSGLHIYFELDPIKTPIKTRIKASNQHGQFTLGYFHLKYNPKKMLPGSYFRRVLGNEPLKYTKDDIRVFAQNSIYISHGQVLEFYLRLPEDINKEIDEGPLLAVSLKTGEIIGYPAATNVDASALRYFVRGMSIELQRAMTKPAGNWHIGKSIDEEELLRLVELEDSH